MLANTIENWGDFVGADVRYAISSTPKLSKMVLIWIWFSTINREDSSFVFALDTDEQHQLAWLEFLSHSRKLAIRNGSNASGATNVLVTFEEGDALNFLRGEIARGST